jgi:hypothetical protein
MASRQINDVTDSFASKLAKLIPAEVSAAYLAINSIVNIDEGFSPKMWASLAALTVFCALYLWKVLGVTSQLQIAFTTASFPVWALNISSARLIDRIDSSTLGIALILVTVAIPLIPTSPRSGVDG